jgi:multidrug efflux pump subunit AcrA (membrane-fusion protein)
VTRTFEARYVLDGNDIPLGATVTIQLDGHGNGVSVPLGAITDRGGGPGVWVLTKGATAVSFRPVQVDKMGSEDALLSGGVKAGETVVALGAHLLEDGEHVRVTKKAALAKE